MSSIENLRNNLRKAKLKLAGEAFYKSDKTIDTLEDVFCCFPHELMVNVWVKFEFDGASKKVYHGSLQKMVEYEEEALYAFVPVFPSPDAEIVDILPIEDELMIIVKEE